MDINRYWKAALAQQPEEMKAFFQEDASINWYNTNEHFTVDELSGQTVNTPGKWGGEIERIEQVGNLIITVVHVYSLDQKVSCHAVSFIEVESDKIASMDEYWGDDVLLPYGD